MLHLRLTDRDIEQVLAGHQPPGRTDLAEVAKLVAQIKAMSGAEQTPPMSPRLLAELDASELQRRSDHTGRERHGRAHLARRRWRVVGAAAVVVVLGGAVMAGLRDTGRDSQTEIENTGGSGSTPSSAPSTEQPADTPATTAAPTTAAPPPSQSASPAPPATMAPHLEPQQDQPRGDGHQGPPPPGDGPDIHDGGDTTWEDCLQEHADVDCWLEVYEQGEGHQPGR